MAAGVPEYQSRVQPADAPGIVVRALPAPQMPHLETGAAAVGAAATAAGKQAVDISLRVQNAQDVARTARARTDYVTGLSELEQRYQQDPDPATAPQRFREDVAALESSSLEGIENDVHRGAATLQMRTSGIGAARRMDAWSLRRSAADGQVDAGKRRDAYLRDASTAVTPVARDATISLWDQDVDQRAQAQWISELDAQWQKHNFRADVARNDAQALIETQPDNAVLALETPHAFAELPDVERLQLADLAAKRARQHEAQDEQAPAALGFDMLRQGTLTPEWLQANAPFMPASTNETLSGAVNAPAPAAIDHAEAHRLLMGATNDWSGTLDQAADALRRGAIDRPTFDRIYDTAQRFQHNVEDDRGWAIGFKADIVEALKPEDERGLRRQVDALGAFEQWLEQNPDAGEEEAGAQASALIAGARDRAARGDRQTLPMPRFVNAPRHGVDGETITSVAERLRDAHAVGEVGDDDLVRQVELLRKWQRVVQDESGEK